MRAPRKRVPFISDDGAVVVLPVDGLGRLAFALDQLPARDQRRLTDLVRKYGVELIAEAAREVPIARPGKRGRPRLPRSLLRQRLAMAAEWIERRREEHRRAGKPNPLKCAYVDFHEVQQEFLAKYDGKKKRADVPLRTIKKLHQTGRGYLKEIQAEEAAIERHVSAWDRAHIRSILGKGLFTLDIRKRLIYARYGVEGRK
jgi:hypothetical protein